MGTHFPKQLKLRCKKRPVLPPFGKDMKLAVKGKLTVVFNHEPKSKVAKAGALSCRHLLVNRLFPHVDNPR